MENSEGKVIYCERCGFLDIIDKYSSADSMTCFHCKIPMKFLDRDDIVSYKDWQLRDNQAFLDMNGYTGDGKWGGYDYEKDLEQKVINEYISELPTFDKYAMYDRLDKWRKHRANMLQQYRDIKAQKAAAEASKPKCPTCGSTNVKPISGGERAASIIGFGLFSKKIGKSYKCLNCKYTW